MKIALVQFRFSTDTARNLRQGQEGIRQALGRGAQIVCLPEFFPLPAFSSYAEDSRYFDLAEPVPGPTTEAIAPLARAGPAMVIVPLFERAEDGSTYNTAVVLGPDGQVVGKYRKAHIPDVRPQDGLHTVGYEAYYFRPGNLGFPVFETPWGARFGVLICYDRHYPEAARSLALAGADLIFVPAASAGTFRDSWRLGLQGHAVVNQCYMAGLNRRGADEGGPPNVVFYGSSIVVGPMGETLAEAGDAEDAVLVADVDIGHSRQLRQRLGYFRHRRPDLYGMLAQQRVD